MTTVFNKFDTENKAVSYLREFDRMAVELMSHDNPEEAHGEPYYLQIVLATEPSARLFFDLLKGKLSTLCISDIEMFYHRCISVTLTSQQAAIDLRKAIERLINLSDNYFYSSLKDDFQKNWLTNKPTAMNIESLYVSNKPMGTWKEVKDKLDVNLSKDCLYDDKMNLISDYTIEQWKSEMFDLIQNNWDVKDDDTRALLNEVIESVQKHFYHAGPHGLNMIHQMECIFSAGLSHISGSSKPELTTQMLKNQSQELKNSKFRQWSIKQVDKQIEPKSQYFKGDTMAHKILDGNKQPYEWLPNHYFEAKDAKIIRSEFKAPDVVFSDHLLRDQGRVFRSPSRELCLHNVLFISGARSIPPVLALIDYLITDLINCKGVMFSHLEREALITLSQNKEEMESINIDTFWDDLYGKIEEQTNQKLFNS